MSGQYLKGDVWAISASRVPLAISACPPPSFYFSFTPAIPGAVASPPPPPPPLVFEPHVCHSAIGASVVQLSSTRGIPSSASAVASLG